MFIRTILCLFVFTALFTVTVTNTHAQDDAPITLDDIFSTEKDYGNGDKPLTPKFMANHYYKNCLISENITMTAREKELLCTCTAAKSSQILTVDEFKVLNEKTKAGKYARGKFIAYAYVPCMPFVMESVVINDCKKTKLIQDIVIGKNKICKCASDQIKTYIKQNQVTVLDIVLRNHPRTLNPLEYYIRERAYTSQRDSSINNCKYNFLYDRDN